MDKKAIKTFAIESRKKLIEEVKYQCSLLGITGEGIADPVEKAEGMEVYDIGGSTPYTIYDEAIDQRKDLVRQVKEKGFDNVVEEVAYTWFNRIIAIRFMEVNDYLPTRVRVLSSISVGKVEPDIVTEAPNLDLGFSPEEIKFIFDLKSNNELDELFRFLFIKQCNKLNEILPELFEKTTDYTELLLSISFTNADGVLRQLIDSISEENFKDQVEIIGWLYQYYITELVELVYDGSMKRGKIPKEYLPAATQIFTPDWPIKYMVENSLGKLWVKRTQQTDVNKKWKYYLINKNNENNYEVSSNTPKVNPEDLKIIDPAMGSGHILVYVFEVLMEIYTSLGYTKRSAAISIIENNIYGLDIDKRAYQLAYFALMMKVREYNRNAFDKDLNINLSTIYESNNISKKMIDSLCNENVSIKKDLEYLLDTFEDAKEFGSIIKINFVDICGISNQIEKTIDKKYLNSLSPIILQNHEYKTLKYILKQSEILLYKYDIVITNPPYLNRARMDKKLSNFTKKEYPDTKSDLSAIFYQKAIDDFCKNDGYISFITTTSWMFLKTFKNFRNHFLNIMSFESIVDFGSELFEGKVGHNLITACVAKKNQFSNNRIISIDLSDYCYSKRHLKEKEFFNEKNRFYPIINNFLKIPGNPIAYWVSESFIKIFENPSISKIAIVRKGMDTANNNYFLRFWYEVDYVKIGFNILNGEELVESTLKWIPYNKGGKYKKWYGNQEYVINWENNGRELKNFKKANLRSKQFYFKKGLTWTLLSSSNFGLRFLPEGFIFDSNGSMIFCEDSKLFYLEAFLLSKVAQYILNIFSTTMAFNISDIANLPIIFSSSYKDDIDKLTKQNIHISKSEWDNYELSWNFKVHPLLKFESSTIETAFNCWDEYTYNQFNILKENEENLNTYFIDIYGLNEEFSQDITDDDITFRKSNSNEDVKSFISYAVGCLLGRYSLDEEGLIFAGGTWDPSKYSKFLPDNDNIIPILDTEYFEDDIVGRFVEFVKVTFGEDNLEENLDFIASALKKKGSTSREVIRNYFLTDFYKDHMKTYKKHPIYWLFDSGRNNGFKALSYMHRYEPDLVARVRTDYLHKTQKALETAIANNERIIDNSTNASEKAKAVKTKDKLIKQLEETRKYDEALAHVANQKIEIDLDDGVKVNYAKFQGVEVSSEGQKAKKIDLLKKI